MAAKQMICLWAPSGHAKTSLLGTFVTGLYRATGKRARLYNVDGGVASIQHLSPTAVDIWEMGDQPYAFEAMNDASRGYWPKVMNDFTSPLEPPTIVRYVAECAPCGMRSYDEAKAAGQTTIPCKKCKAILPIRARQAYNPANGLDEAKIGVLMFEGMTGFAEKMMDNMSDRSAKGEKVGEDVAVRLKDGNLDVGGVSRSAYGIAQRRIKRAVENSRMVPGVDYVIWTAHKARGEDDVKRSPVFGPKIVGSAATDDVPRWFGPCLGVSKWPTGTSSEFRVYLSTYFESFNQITKDVAHICNSRIPPSVLNGVPEYYKFDKDAKGKFGGETLLWDIVQMIEEKQKQAAEQALAGKK